MSLRMWFAASFGAWSLAAVSLALLTGACEAELVRMNVELPWLTVRVLTVGKALRTGWGVVPFVGALAVFLVNPLVVLHGPSRAPRRWYRLASIQAVIASVSVGYVLDLPCTALQQCLCFHPPPLGVVVAVVSVIGVAVAQGVAWWAMAREVAAARSGVPSVEVARALVIAVVPGLPVALVVFLTIDAAGAPAPDWLMVTPATGAGVTVALAAWGLALRGRLLKGSPPDGADVLEGHARKMSDGWLARRNRHEGGAVLEGHALPRPR